MKKLAVLAGFALITVSTIGSADAQRWRGGGGGWHGGGWQAEDGMVADGVAAITVAVAGAMAVQ